MCGIHFSSKLEAIYKSENIFLASIAISTRPKPLPFHPLPPFPLKKANTNERMSSFSIKKDDYISLCILTLRT